MIILNISALSCDEELSDAPVSVPLESRYVMTYRSGPSKVHFSSLSMWGKGVLDNLLFKMYCVFLSRSAAKDNLFKLVFLHLFFASIKYSKTFNTKSSITCIR